MALHLTHAVCSLCACAGALPGERRPQLLREWAVRGMEGRGGECGVSPYGGPVVVSTWRCVVRVWRPPTVVD